jgi:hypothetical protein
MLKQSRLTFLFFDDEGRRFRFGTIGSQNVVMVMTGLSMV